MSYTPTTWTTGDTITASSMNKIENGIANASGVSGLCSCDGSSLDKSYNELMTILNAGVLPFYIKSNGGIAYLSEIDRKSVV